MYTQILHFFFHLRQYDYITIAASFFVSALISGVTYCLLTQEFPPKLTSIKSLYATFSKLKELNKLSPQILLAQKQSAANNFDFPEVKATETLDAEGVADRVRTETIRSQNEAQNSMLVQHLKAELFDLKNQNELLKKQVEQLTRK